MRRATAAQIAAVQPITEPAADAYEARAAIFAGTLDLKDLDLEERAFLGTCQDLYRNEQGCGTPFENFVRTIIRWTTWGNSPTPEFVIDEIKENFERDWDLTVHSVKRFMQHYPNLISSFREGLEAPAATPALPAEPERTQPTGNASAKAPRARKPRKKAAHA
jgi:hypothetical protein